MNSMRRLPFLILLALVMSASCSCSSDVTSEYSPEAAKLGREAAEEVLSAPVGSMQRENLILAIKANSERIRQSGDSVAARSYEEAAYHVLDSAGVFKTR